MPSTLRGRSWRRGQCLDLSDQKAFLVRELVIFCAVVEKVGEKLQQPFAIIDENALDCK